MFESKGGGFDKHVKEDHNMWNYVYLLVYLRAKPATEYNGWEQYVQQKVTAEDTSFLPRNTALVLKEVHDREEAEGRALGAKLDALDATLERHAQQTARQIAESHGHVHERLDSVERLLQVRVPLIIP